MSDRVTPQQYRDLVSGKVPPKRRNKYGARKTNGFDSAKEARRAAALGLMERAGEISGLRKQVKFSLAVNGEHVCTYTADFVYERGGKRIVEDVKGFTTDVYRIKRALMLACYGIEILET